MWPYNTSNNLMFKCTNKCFVLCFIVIMEEGLLFLSRPYKFRCQNGDFVIVETEWSSFINPWGKKLEFIIGNHRVLTVSATNSSYMCDSDWGHLSYYISEANYTLYHCPQWKPLHSQTNQVASSLSQKQTNSHNRLYKTNTGVIAKQERRAPITKTACSPLVVLPKQIRDSGNSFMLSTFNSEMVGYTIDIQLT